MAETVNGLYKTEVIRRRGPWRTLEAVEFATLELAPANCRSKLRFGGPDHLREKEFLASKTA